MRETPNQPESMVLCYNSRMLLAFSLLATLTCARDLSAALSEKSVGTGFDIEATALVHCAAPQRDFSVEDTTGRVVLSPDRRLGSGMVSIGDRIRAQGIVTTTDFGHVYAACTNIEILATGLAAPTIESTVREIKSGSRDACRVRVSGILLDYFTDEVDFDWRFLILAQSNETIYAACRLNVNGEEAIRFFTNLFGREITVTGLCNPHPSGCRRNIGRILQFNDLRDIEVDALDKSSDPFSVPVIDVGGHLQPAELRSLGRRRVTGRVIAVWDASSILLKTPSNGISRVDLVKQSPPHCGDSIEIVGFPETDLFRVNFSCAIWRPAPFRAEMEESVADITADMLVANRKGKSVFNPSWHGHTVRLRGIVRSLPSIGNDGRIYLESGGYTLPVDICAAQQSAGKLAIGSVVDVTGVCVMDIENWRTNLIFPHIKAMMLVTRTPADIVVIRRPPWWTPARLMIVVGSLFLALLGILVWNRSLQTLAHRRGKALANEELERLESDLKVCERTRLAVELHDSIAQNLTGVSMEIDTALRDDEPLPATAAQHMGRALRTIDSCRNELRNCIWDLRSQALEEDDMDKAIRLTLSQTIGKVDLSVRFNVPRSCFTDNTAHTILRIIRELAANAVRHGKATEIKVAGSIEDGILRFSVRDNGCGFDPDACPGVLDGHFGLQGVRERIASLDGDIRIESTPSKGTKVIVSINSPQTEDETRI